MISGKQFKQLYPKKFIALSSVNPFKQPIEFISLNDLADNLIKNWNSMLYYVDVTIPDDCDVMISPKNEFSSTNAILSEITNLTDNECWHDEEFCKKVIVKYHYILKYVKCQTSEICKMAVDFYADNFEFVNDKTYDLCLKAVKGNGLMLQFIENQTYELCMEAVRNNGYALKYVKLDQTEELCIEAVNNYPDALQFVKIQTPEICNVAVKKDSRSIKYVKEQTDELCWIALKNNAYSFNEIINPTNEMFEYTVEYDPSLYMRLENPSDDLLLLALKHSTWLLLWDDIRDKMTFDMYKQAVKYNGLILEYVENPTFEMCRDAVTNHCLSLKFIKDKTIYISLYDSAFKLFENKYHDLFLLLNKLKVSENKNIKWINENYSKENMSELSKLYFNIQQNVIWGFKDHVDTYSELFDKYGVDHYKVGVYKGDNRERYYQFCVSDGDFEIIGNHRILLYAIVQSNAEYIFEFIMGNYTKLINEPLAMESALDMYCTIQDLLYEIRTGHNGRIGKTTIIHEWNPDYSNSRYKLPDWLEGGLNDMNKDKEEFDKEENDKNKE